MLEHHVVRPRRVRRRTLLIAVALMAPLAALGSASSALAAPKGIFAVFAQCPTSTPGVALCQYAEVTSGEYVLGSLRVPIDKTIVLQGGGLPTGLINEYFTLPAANGESISKTELNVPGGLVGLGDCAAIQGRGFFENDRRAVCRSFFGNRFTDVTATIEGVASTTNPSILNVGAFFAREDTALVLPIRVHLKNPLLGSACYIGSEASPIELRLTTGTTSPPKPNEPIKGTRGASSTETETIDGKEAEVSVSTEASLVDNSFSVPKAEGCGGFLSSVVDPILNAKLGLESPSGHNTAILTGPHRSAFAEEVIASEQSPTDSNNPPQEEHGGTPHTPWHPRWPQH